MKIAVLTHLDLSHLVHLLNLELLIISDTMEYYIILRIYPYVHIYIYHINMNIFIGYILLMHTKYNNPEYNYPDIRMHVNGK